MVGDWTIRRAEPGDADALARCIEAAYAAYADRGLNLPPVSAGVAQEIAEHIVWVAETEDGIVGGLVLVPEGAVLLLANVAVRPDQKGTGLGRRLLTLAETEARSRGHTGMRLNTHVDLTEVVDLYVRNGWAIADRRGNTVSLTKALM